MTTIDCRSRESIKLIDNFKKRRCDASVVPKLRSTLFSAAAILLRQSPAAFAQESAPAYLAIVTGIGTTPLPGVGQALNEIPAPAQTATGTDIDRSLAPDLTAFMSRNLAGVYINNVQNNPFQPDVSYRGYTKKPLLGTPQGLSISMDGVRLNQAFGDVVSWNLIPRAAIGSLTLMPGSNPLFGLNTLSGALLIQTRDGRTSSGIASQANYGSNNRRAIEFEHGGSNDKGLNWFVIGNRFSEGGWRDSSPSDVRQLFGKLGWADAKTDFSPPVGVADNRLTGNGLQEQRMLSRNYRSIYRKADVTVNKSARLDAPKM